MSDLFDEPDHATPLTPEERRDLIPAYIAYGSELNAAEQENIARAQDWALARKRDLLIGVYPWPIVFRQLAASWGARG